MMNDNITKYIESAIMVDTLNNRSSILNHLKATMTRVVDGLVFDFGDKEAVVLDGGNAYIVADDEHTNITMTSVAEVIDFLNKWGLNTGATAAGDTIANNDTLRVNSTMNLTTTTKIYDIAHELETNQHNVAEVMFRMGGTVVIRTTTGEYIEIFHGENHTYGFASYKWGETAGTLPIATTPIDLADINGSFKRALAACKA